MDRQIGIGARPKPPPRNCWLNLILSGVVLRMPATAPIDTVTACDPDPDFGGIAGLVDRDRTFIGSIWA